ncbi:hypothetical protein [Piscinibacter sp.]|uniref:hypothetical protein n=1 Tax=Piscinibacter sp. TaxID=1903157 RepID=UPI00355A28AC
MAAVYGNEVLLVGVAERPRCQPGFAAWLLSPSLTWLALDVLALLAFMPQLGHVATDRRIVLDKGHIVEEGDHRTLLARELYARLWAHPSGGFFGENAEEEAPGPELVAWSG